MESIISVEHISKSFEQNTALRDIHFTLKDSHIYGFIGPDGAGKTTLFRIIASLLVPDTGRVTVLGFSTINDYRDIRVNIGYMPGRFSLYQDLTVEENLKFYATVFKTTLENNYHLIKDIYIH